MGIKIKNPLKEVSKGIKNAVKQPLKEVANVGKIALGTAAVVGSGGTVLLFQSKEGKKFLNNKTVDQLTFGMSGDLAGYSSATTKMAGGRDPNKEEIADSFRLVGKTAAIVGTAGLASSAGAGGGAASSFAAKTTSAIVANPIQAYAAGQLAQSSIKSGNYAGALAAIGGNTYLNNILPGGNAGDFLTSLLPTGARPTPPTMAPPPTPDYQAFPDPGPSYSTPTFSSSKKAIPAWAIAAGVVGLAYLAARKL